MLAAWATELRRSRGLDGTFRNKVLDSLALPVGHYGQRKAAPQNILGHAVAHETEANEADAHLFCHSCHYLK